MRIKGTFMGKPLYEAHLDEAVAWRTGAAIYAVHLREDGKPEIVELDARDALAAFQDRGA
jgi:hypothetical protein